MLNPTEVHSPKGFERRHVLHGTLCLPRGNPQSTYCVPSETWAAEKNNRRKMNMKKFKKEGKLFLALSISVLLFMEIYIQGCAQKSTKDIKTLIYHVENEVWNKGNVDLLDEIYDSKGIR